MLTIIQRITFSNKLFAVWKHSMNRRARRTPFRDMPFNPQPGRDVRHSTFSIRSLASARFPANLRADLSPGDCMTGRNGWRLLAAFVLILVVALLRAQNAADRVTAVVPDLLQARADAQNITVPPMPNRNPPLGFPAGSSASLFREVMRSAGIIFSGRVTSIGENVTPGGRSPAAAAIRFHVEHAMRGAVAGEDLTIHEWASPRASGEQYRVGEHVLLFLYAPSRLGLTSTVAGRMGRFDMDSADRIWMDPEHVQIFSGDPVLGHKTSIPYSDFASALQFTRTKE